MLRWKSQTTCQKLRITPWPSPHFTCTWRNSNCFSPWSKLTAYSDMFKERVYAVMKLPNCKCLTPCPNPISVLFNNSFRFPAPYTLQWKLLRKYVLLKLVNGTKLKNRENTVQKKGKLDYWSLSEWNTKYLNSLKRIVKYPPNIWKLYKITLCSQTGCINC